jgi:3-oxoacyl-[acyl-carrier protein] reductase
MTRLAVDDAVVLVTGASRGIGRAIAQRLAAEGAQVYLCARNSPALDSTVADIAKAGGRAKALPVDASDAAAVAAAVQILGENAGRLDMLVNNLGGAGKFGGLMDLTEEDWKRAFDLNVLSMVRFVKASLPWLERSAAPRIVNISSLVGLEPGMFTPHYTTTKAATINLSKILANSLAAKKILVNVVCPGPVHSAAWDANIEATAARLGIGANEAAARVEQEESAKVPLGRIGEGEDIAGIVAYLASQDAGWITGSCFTLDGGKHRAV